MVQFPSDGIQLIESLRLRAPSEVTLDELAFAR